MTRELDVLLPFHVIDDNLFLAIKSCLDALPENSKIIAINTRSDQSSLNNMSREIIEVKVPGGDYMSALQHGLNISEAQFVALMNSDDLVSKDRFQLQISKLKNDNLDICMTDIKKFSKRGTSLPSLMGKAPSFFHPSLLLLGAYRADATWCFLREWANKEKLFCLENDDSDWSVALRVLPNAKIGIINEYHYFYRMHANQFTRKKSIPANQIIERMNSLNLSLGFPSLMSRDYLWLLSPFSYVTKESFHEIMKWLAHVQGSLARIHPQHKDQIDNLVLRRIAILHLSRLRLTLDLEINRTYLIMFAEYCRANRFVRFSYKQLTKLVYQYLKEIKVHFRIFN